jgi:predicted PurR-regulated permease PerM
MFRKKETDKNINYADLNGVIHLLKEILKIAYVLFIILGIYAITIIIKEWHLKQTIVMILKTISPLFIGLFLAWLFDPFISYLEKKGARRTIGALLTYILFIACIVIILESMIPVLSNQMNDFISIVPNVLDKIELWINQIFLKFQSDSFDALAIKDNIIQNLGFVGTNLTSTLPATIFETIKGIISGTGSFVIGVIIGFYLSIGFKNTNELILSFIPSKFRKDAKELMLEVNTTCRQFVKGALIDALVIFIVSSLAFMLCGLKAPLLFGLFCGITNVIPYVGPYIGGIPAVLVAFSQGTTTGIFVLLSIVVIQAIEGNFLQALIMSKSTKLHPVTIITGLLVFGYFFGIIGMVISTPIIGAIKAVFMYFNEKKNIIDFKNDDKEQVE